MFRGTIVRIRDGEMFMRYRLRTSKGIIWISVKSPGIAGGCTEFHRVSFKHFEKFRKASQPEREMKNKHNNGNEVKLKMK